MRKRITRAVVIVMILLFAVGIVAVTPTVIKGYNMYKDAVQTTSIETKVAQLREDDSYVELSDVSVYVIDKVLESEDQRFYQHCGVDFISIMRAMYHNIKAGALIEGGSTITQQLAKNMYFSFEKKLERKVAEVFVAFDLEQMYTKDEILELYLNIAYFGNDCYGLKEASNYYYGTEPLDLSEEQASALVFTLKSPNNYNPQVYQVAQEEEIEEKEKAA